MRKLNLISGALGFAALALTACSSNEPVVNEVAQKDEVRYLRIAISNPAITRAGADDFQVGTNEENAVTSAYFKFYDINGNPVGDSQEVDLEWTPDEGANAGNVGRIATAIVSVSISRGSFMPSYVVAFLNPVDFEQINEKGKMQDLRDQKRDDYKTNDGAFAMSNSVYYGTDDVTGASNVNILGAPIAPAKLFATQEAAAAATDGNTVDIYVERYAAKVNFEFRGAVDDQTVGAYTLSFDAESWSVNADAPNMYASKRFENTATVTQEVPTLSQVNTMLGTWSSWNDAANHRSYWACSPGYYADEFPTVSDDIISKATEDQGTGAGEVVGNYELRYYSYNQISGVNGYNGDGLGVSVAKDGAVNKKYVMENTMGPAAFASLNPKAAAPSVVLVGGYSVKKDDVDIPVGEGFCIYRSDLYWRGTVPVADAEGKNIKNVMLAANQILSKSEALSQPTGSMNLTTGLTDEVLSLFEVKHPDAAVRGTQSVPHRYVTLQLKNTGTPADYAGLYYKPTGQDAWRPLSAVPSTQLENIIVGINKQLWAQIGNARSYTMGKGYFSIPIQHLGYTENTAGAPLTDGVLDWTKVRVGDFGLVRNHVYHIEVTGITGMADGIEGLDNPLVPAMDENTYWAKYRVNILNWRIVPKQSTTL